MGAWGTDLWEDDLSCDIQDEWNELMDEGVGPRKATKIIIKSWQEELSDYDDEEDKLADESILFISLAGLQMRHRALTSSVKKRRLSKLKKVQILLYGKKAMMKVIRKEKRYWKSLKIN